MKMLDIFLLVFSSSANNEGNFYFTENQIGIYLMLIIPTIIMIALLFYKVGSSANYRKNTRIRTEKAEAYQMVKIYVSRMEKLMQAYEMERTKLQEANVMLNAAHFRIACLKSVLANHQETTSFNFFEDVTTREVLKKRYKLLSAAYHPDKGGNLAVIKLINQQYKAAALLHMASCNRFSS